MSSITAALDCHHSLLTVDSHCDTPLSLGFKGYDIGSGHACETLLGGDIDLARMKRGGLGAAFFAVFVAQGPRDPEGHARAKAQALAVLDRLDRMFADFPGACGLALTPEDAVHLHGAGKRAIFIGMENGYPLGLDLAMVDAVHQRGVRYLTLCHSSDNDICASCTSGSDPRTGARSGTDTGLSPFGVQVVGRMNDLGMMVDLSHTSARTVADVLAISRAPAFASHSGARAVCDHPRNLSDPQIAAIAAHGGVIQVPFVPEFLKPAPPDPEGSEAHSALWRRAKAHYTDHAIGEDPGVDAGFEAEHRRLREQFPPFQAALADVVDHIDHIVQVAGMDSVGIGTDFDGGGRLRDCRDVSELPGLTRELARRGYSRADLGRIWGGNLMRMFAKVLVRRWSPMA